MRLLLDTHTLIWWWLNDPRIGSVKALIATSDAMISAVNIWEIVGKERIGRFPEATPFIDRLRELVVRDGFGSLSITVDHAERAAGYVQDHADPFDRLLAAQAELEGLVLVTRDKAFAGFPCATRW